MHVKAIRYFISDDFFTLSEIRRNVRMATVTFAEKLAKLTEDDNKSKVAAKAGLPPTAISDYINKGNIPRSDKALALAKALRVPLEWLVDDAMDLPVPPELKPAAPSASMLSDDDLLFELARRYRNDMIRLDKLLTMAEQIDYGLVRDVMKTGMHTSPSMQKDMAAITTVPGMITFEVIASDNRYSIDKAAQDNHERLPGKERKPEYLTIDAMKARFAKLKNKPGFKTQLMAAIKFMGEGGFDQLMRARERNPLLTIADQVLAKQNKDK